MNILGVEIIILIVCIVLSGFFSGSETALFSLKKIDLHKFSHSKNHIERSIHRWMLEPHAILITILIGNLFANIVVTALSTRLLLMQWGHYGHFISIAVVTPIIIILCEITPKIISINLYRSLSIRMYPILSVFHKLFYPVRIMLIQITDILIKVFRLKLTHREITEDELGYAVKVGEQKGIIDRGEGAFIKNVLRFSKKYASNVMFPRSRAVFIPYGATIAEAMKTFLETEVIRAPIYKEDLDHIIGMVDSRELIPYHLGYKKARNINRFIKEIKFFPASRDINDLLNDFIGEGIQIAVIVDEYGGTDGIVTLNKILAELMGSELNKWEEDYRLGIRKLDDNISIISGEMQIEDFNYLFEDTVESQESDSIGGYILEKTSDFPRRGQEVMTDKYILRVRYIRKNKIETIEVIQRRPGEG